MPHYDRGQHQAQSGCKAHSPVQTLDVMEIYLPLCQCLYLYVYDSVCISASASMSISLRLCLYIS